MSILVMRSCRRTGGHPRAGGGRAAPVKAWSLTGPDETG
ncbi:hypothetical protein [Azospirillum palustre]